MVIPVTILLFFKPLLWSNIAFNVYLVSKEPLAYISALPSLTNVAHSKAISESILFSTISKSEISIFPF